MFKENTADVLISSMDSRTLNRKAEQHIVKMANMIDAKHFVAKELNVYTPSPFMRTFLTIVSPVNQRKYVVLLSNDVVDRGFPFVEMDGNKTVHFVEFDPKGWEADGFMDPTNGYCHACDQLEDLVKHTDIAKTTGRPQSLLSKILRLGKGPVEYPVITVKFENLFEEILAYEDSRK